MAISDIDDPESYPNSCDPRSCDCEAVGFVRQGAHLVFAKPPPRMDTGTYTIISASDSAASDDAA